MNATVALKKNNELKNSNIFYKKVDKVFRKELVVETFELCKDLGVEITEKNFNNILSKLTEKSEIAFKDSLSGITSRNGLDFFLENSSEEFDSYRFVYSIDLNYLKVFNDSYGHDAGDWAIKTVATKLNNFCSSLNNPFDGCSIKKIATQNVAIRNGGDEFILILKEKISEEKITDLFNESFVMPNGQVTNISISIGSCFFNGKETFTSALKIADDLMSSSKKANKKVRATSEVEQLKIQVNQLNSKVYELNSELNNLNRQPKKHVAIANSISRIFPSNKKTALTIAR